MRSFIARRSAARSSRVAVHRAFLRIEEADVAARVHAEGCERAVAVADAEEVVAPARLLARREVERQDADRDVQVGVFDEAVGVVDDRDDHGSLHGSMKSTARSTGGRPV
jgi:hypothetical protein